MPRLKCLASYYHLAESKAYWIALPEQQAYWWADIAKQLELQTLT